MTYLKQFEVRLRGEFMFDGKIVYAQDHITAMRNTLGGNNTTCVVIESDDPEPADWRLISANCTHVNWSGGSHPHPRDPKSRLAFARKCETILQNNARDAKKGNAGVEFSDILRFTDFDPQFKKYEKECAKDQKQLQKDIYIEIAESIKELAISEAFTIKGKHIKAERAIARAADAQSAAYNFGKRTRIPGATEPNTEEKAVAKANEQFEKTLQKNRDFRNKEYEREDATYNISREN